MDRLPRLLEPILWPMACAHRTVMNIRNHAYDQGWLPAVDAGCPVISIGNITAGGTGKTPLTALLLEEFLARGRRVGLVSRGYGGTEKGPIRVPTGESEPGRAGKLGDEPTWLAAKFPEVPVVIGADRVAAVRYLLESAKQESAKQESTKPDAKRGGSVPAEAGAVELVLADDAFQHRRLKRSLDIVVIDASEPLWHYRPLPLGREREGFGALERANAVFITKTNLASVEALASIRHRVSCAVGKSASQSVGQGVPLVFEMESWISSFARLAPSSGSEQASTSLATSEFVGKRVLLVSGIGRPLTFDTLITQCMSGVDIADHLIFADHHPYGAEDLMRIERRAQEVGAEVIVTTEKDAVKLPAWNPAVPCYVSRLELRVSGEGRPLGEFYENVDRQLF